jgi:hypothetical protein
MPRSAAALLLAALALPTMAVDTPAWPPSGDVAARMSELQRVISDPQSTPPQREAARAELSGLLKSPAGQSRRTPDEKPAHAPRAAIEPLGAIVRPAVNPRVPVPGVATVDVIVPPPRISIVPQTGAVVSPSGRTAVDPRTGNILHETPAGYIDPRTGQFTPR